MLERRHVLRLHSSRIVAVFVALALAAAPVRARAQATPAAPASAAPASAPPVSTPPAAAPAPAAPPTKEQLAESKKSFDAGLKLLKEKLYQEALASFVEANRIAPRESSQNNIALCNRNLRDFAAAYDAYDVLLARYGDKMKPAAKADAQRALEELAILTGIVGFGVAETGAKIVIDTRDYGLTPPPRPIRLNLGPHQVTVTKAGFETLAQPIEIRGHDTVEITGPLVKEVLTGRVKVSLQKADPTAKVLVDGKEVGPPPWQGDLDPGPHVVEARGQTTTSEKRPVDVQKKATYDIILELRSQQGTIAVNVDVPDTEISIDGKAVGRGVWEGPLPAGTHELGVAKEGYAKYVRSVEVHESERVVQNVSLQREVPAAQAAPPPVEWPGVYAQFNFVGLFPVGAPSNDVAQGVGYTKDTTINGSAQFGGGINLRVGYSFGVVGIEGSLLGGYDHTSTEVKIPGPQVPVAHPGPPRTENWDFHRFGGAAAVALRLMPLTQTVRPTLGVGGGLAFHGMAFQRNASTVARTSTMVGSPATYIAPQLILDGGLILGDTPGTRFYLGVLVVAEFASATSAGGTVDPTTDVPVPPAGTNVVNGTDIFIGPILGMQFGQ